MMNIDNSVALTGRMVNEVKANTFLNGNGEERKVVNFKIAVDNIKKKGEDKPSTNFIDCKAFSPKADFIEKYISVGDLFTVIGSIQTGVYEKDGVKKYPVYVQVEDVKIRKKKTASSSTSAKPTEAAINPDDFEGLEDEGLPFI